MQKEIEELRTKITQIDATIAELLQERTVYVKAIANYKRKHNIPIMDIAREQLLYGVYAPYTFHDSSSVWKEIFAVSKTIQGCVCYVDTLEHVCIAKVCLGVASTMCMYPTENTTIMERKNSIVFCGAESSLLKTIQENEYYINAVYSVSYSMQPTKSADTYVLLSALHPEKIQTIEILL